MTSKWTFRNMESELPINRIQGDNVFFDLAVLGVSEGEEAGARERLEGLERFPSRTFISRLVRIRGLPTFCISYKASKPLNQWLIFPCQKENCFWLCWFFL